MIYKFVTCAINISNTYNLKNTQNFVCTKSKYATKIQTIAYSNYLDNE